jgi:hypothetical protein
LPAVGVTRQNGKFTSVSPAAIDEQIGGRRGFLGTASVIVMCRWSTAAAWIGDAI